MGPEECIRRVVASFDEQQLVYDLCGVMDGPHGFGPSLRFACETLANLFLVSGE